MKVRIWGSLAPHAGGQTELEVGEVRNVRELLEALVERYPGLAPQIERGVSVSIDGQIVTDDWTAPIRPDSEVVLLRRLVGG